MHDARCIDLTERNGVFSVSADTPEARLRQRVIERAARLLTHEPLCSWRHRLDLEALRGLALRAALPALAARVDLHVGMTGTRAFRWRFCAACGGEIATPSLHQLYCSTTCRSRGWRSQAWVSTTEGVLRKFGLTIGSAWRTPLELIAWLQERWGHFSLDAAALPHHAVCSAFIAPWDDAFVVPWLLFAQGPGPYFLNPPYAREAGRAELGGGLLSWFIRGHHQALEANRNVVIVAPSGDGAEYAHYASRVGREIVHLRGRVSHRDPLTGKMKAGTRFGTSIFVLGVRPSTQDAALESRARIDL